MNTCRPTSTNSPTIYGLDILETVLAIIASQVVYIQCEIDRQTEFKNDIKVIGTVYSKKFF